MEVSRAADSRDQAATTGMKLINKLISPNIHNKELNACGTSKIQTRKD